MPGARSAYVRFCANARQMRKADTHRAVCSRRSTNCCSERPRLGADAQSDDDKNRDQAMTEVDRVAAVTVKTERRWSAFRSWKIIAVLAIAIAACAGGAYWFLAPRQAAPIANNHVAELPLYLEIKPFVVSVANDAGSPHFVQLGINLAVPGKMQGTPSPAVLPEVQDTLRQTALGFKVEDIVTPAGVDKLRGR